MLLNSISFLPLLYCLAFGAGGGSAVQQKTECGERIERSLVSATAHHKRLVVKFGASWCAGCHELERFLLSKPFQDSMGRYYDVLCIDYGEDIIQKESPDYFAKHKHLEVPGARTWLKRHGLKENMPEIAILDEQGKAVVCYEHPYQGAQSWERFYYPPDREADVSVALKFFADGNPAMNKKDLQNLQRDITQKLRRHR